MAPRREPGGSVIRTRDRRGGGAGPAARGVARRAGSSAASAALGIRKDGTSLGLPAGAWRSGGAAGRPGAKPGREGRREGEKEGRECAGRRAVAMAARPVLRCPRPGGHVRGGHQRALCPRCVRYARPFCCEPPGQGRRCAAGLAAVRVLEVGTGGGIYLRVEVDFSVRLPIYS